MSGNGANSAGNASDVTGVATMTIGADEHGLKLTIPIDEKGIESANLRIGWAQAPNLAMMIIRQCAEHGPRKHGDWLRMTPMDSLIEQVRADIETERVRAARAKKKG